MSLENISLSAYIVGKLRKAIHVGDLIDYNAANRSAQFSNFIFPDSPMIQKLMKNKNNFPRISIESTSQSTDHRLGQMSDSYLMRETLKITCYSVRDLICTIKNTVDETIPWNPLVDIYPLDNLPLSDIVAVREGATTFVKGTDYRVIDNDYDGFKDSIEWLGVNEPTTDFDVTYNRKSTGQELVRIMAQNLNEYFRKNWRTQWAENKAFNYKLIASSPIDFENDAGLYRYEMTVQFSTFDGTEIV